MLKETMDDECIHMDKDMHDAYKKKFYIADKPIEGEKSKYLHSKNNISISPQLTSVKLMSKS